MIGAKIERFEDLIAWQKARELTAEIYRVTNNEKFAKDFGLRNQIRDASVSIMSNIAEGYERYNPKGFHYFLSMLKHLAAKFAHTFTLDWMQVIFQMKNLLN